MIDRTSTPARIDDLPALLAREAPPHRPLATYRLQFHAGFTFRDARNVVPYLHELGVSDVYASPYQKARAGSSHGYDVANPNTLNPEIGTEDDYRAYVEELASRGMGQVLDTVPNHMGIGDANNVWWQDVLENGPASVYADFFDIDWTPAITADPLDSPKVVIPVLGDQYGRVLENAELCIALEPTGLFVRYWDFRLPLAPESYVRILDLARAALPASAHDEDAGIQSILRGLRQLPSRARTDGDSRELRNRLKEPLKRQVIALHEDSAPFRTSLEHVLARLNGRKDDPLSFDDLDALLSEQSYRLAYWRVAAEEINYRRFFDINDLAAVRVEDPEVFRATHALLLVLIRLGAITGVRIDHPDGLRDPAGHLWRLQRACFVERYADKAREALLPDADRALVERELGALYDRLRAEDPGSPLLRAVYMVVEKILAAGEQLPRDWPVNGTTGYDFMNQLNGIFVDRDNRAAFDASYAAFTGTRQRYVDLANSTRKMVMLVSLPGELNGLAYRLKQLANRDRRHRDFTLNALTFAIREFIACLPVYRTYIDPDSGAVSDSGREVIERTTDEVKRRNPRTDPTIFDFIRDQLVPVPLPPQRDRLGEGASPDQDRMQFVARFQQVSGPVMAKGVEDTAFYQYNRLVSLNEVGGDPDQFGWSLTAFHRANATRRDRWPLSMLSTSTHDSKRSEDVRARLNIVSELPRQWRAGLSRWARANMRHKTGVDGRPAPDRNDEYLLYQTLLGAWPLHELNEAGYGEWTERVLAFMLKAVKEAKANTSWINPNAEYEAALATFVRAVLDRSASSAFLDDFLQLERTVADLGLFNSLSQTLLKFASPGVPDVYQGNDTWDFSLVDPDNRRPVDYTLRRKLLQAARCADPEELVGTRADGRIKVFLTHRCLRARQDWPELFLDGGYQPLRAEGSAARHVCAFARTHDGRSALAIAPVLVSALTSGAEAPMRPDVWGDTRLRLSGRLGRRFRNLLTDDVHEVDSGGNRGYLPLGEVLRRFPVALLLSE
ncbi:MAG: malto-oligosyltrehalose synthase [Chloroflexi bacterium]|nr:malto-oligosyltrehalose synthase [Chloroflexota bacterium]